MNGKLKDLSTILPRWIQIRIQAHTPKDNMHRGSDDLYVLISEVYEPLSTWTKTVACATSASAQV